jgi:hypothetical protein
VKDVQRCRPVIEQEWPYVAEACGSRIIVARNCKRYIGMQSKLAVESCHTFLFTHLCGKYVV